MSNFNSPHDKLFKIALSRPKVAKDFLQRYLPPDIRAVANLETLKQQPISFIDEKLKAHEADVLYTTHFGDKPGYIYILFEHLSNPDKTIPFRLLKYMVNIMHRHLAQNNTHILPIIYPLIVYTGAKKYSYSTDIFDLFGTEKELAKSIFLQPYQLLDIEDIPDDDLKNQLILRAMVNVMKIDVKDGYEMAQRLLHIFFDLEKSDSDFTYYVIEYISVTKELTDKKTFFDTLITNLSSQTGGKIMTIAEQLRQEGREQGIQQGMQQGMQQGAQQTLEHVAMLLLDSHESIEKIEKITGLSEEKIRILKEKVH